MIRAGVAAVVAALAVSPGRRAPRSTPAPTGAGRPGQDRRAGRDRPARAGARPGRGGRGAAAGARARPRRGRAAAARPHAAALPGPRRLPGAGPGDVLPAGRGRLRRRGDHGRRRRLVWDTDQATVRTFQQAGAQAVRPDGRVYVAADDVDGLSVYDLASGGDHPTPLTVFSANDQSVPVLAFSPDGSLLAEGRRSWVTLWDLRNPSAPRQLGAWHSNVGDPTALAVLDDGRVLVGSATTAAGGVERARRRQLGDVGPGRHRRRRPAPGRGHGRRTVLIDFPRLSTHRRGRHRHRHHGGQLQRDGPERTAESTLPPVSWTSTCHWTAGPWPASTWPAAATSSTPRTGTCSPPSPGATPHWSPRRPSTAPGCSSPPASTGRSGCGTPRAATPTCPAPSPTTCAASSGAASTPTAGARLRNDGARPAVPGGRAVRAGTARRCPARRTSARCPR